MNKQKIAYWIVAGLFSGFMLLSGFNFLFNRAEVAQLFGSLGFPVFLIVPMGIAKLLGVVAILTRKSKTLKEWAFGGFFFDFTLAVASHIVANDGMFMMPVIALVLLFGTYYLDKKVFEGF
jgi:hypothetical protein